MNKAAPVIVNDADADIRDAARRAAKREGLSLGEWLEGVMTARAQAMGISPSDLGADDCFDAVADRLRADDDNRPAHFVTAEKALAAFQAGRSRADDSATRWPDRRLGTEDPTLSIQANRAPRRAASWLSPRPDVRQASSNDAGRQDDQATEADEDRDAPRRGARQRDVEQIRIAQPHLAAVEPVAAAIAVPPRAAPPPPPAEATDMEAERVSIEAKLKALFQALDRSAGRTPASVPAPAAALAPVPAAVLSPVPAAAPAPVAAAPAPVEEKVQPFVAPALRETPVERPQPDVRTSALSSSFSLDRAIAAIAERQAFLEGSIERLPERETRPPARHKTDDLLDQYEQAFAPHQRPGAMEPAPPAPSVAVAEPVEVPQHVAKPDDFTPAAAFTSLQTDLARMSTRLESMIRDVSDREPPAPVRDPAVDEIRFMLDRMRPDQSIDALEQRVAALTAKIDQAIETQLQPEAIERLSQRIEHVQTSLTERLAAELPQAVDPTTIERAIQGIVGSIAALQHDSADVRALEGMVRQLAEKLDDSAGSRVDAGHFAELQAQVSMLAERLQRSDAGLTAIMSVERSMGDLFSQIEETRDAAINAAENAARTAARDTLRSAMTDAGFTLGQSATASDAAMEQVTQEISDLRTAREVADKRLHGILGALNMTLEKVVERLTALEDESAAPRGAPAGQAVPASSARTPADAPVVANPLNAAHRSRPIAPLEAAVQIAAPRRADRPGVAPAVGDADVLIEPGARQDPSRPAHPAGEAPPVSAATAATLESDPASFIAAARRAAQSAAKDAANRATIEAAARSMAAPAAAVGDTTSTAARAGAFMATRRRPLLLAVAGLVMLMGAVQVARLALAPGDTASLEERYLGAKAPVVASLAGAGTSKTIAADDPTAPGAAESKSIEGTMPAAVVAPAPAPVVAEASPKPAPAKTLPSLAMGADANLAGMRAGPPAGIGAGLRDMANDGSATAQYEIGLRFADGRGVARDLKAAADWFEKAASQGLAPAAYRLGSLYEKGLGVAKDPVLSVQWYQKAAEKGNVRAMHNLAVMSAEGAGGKSDYAKAASWFTKAAESGVRDSQFNLAILYARGLGIEQNLAQSYMWFTVAAAQGDTDAAKKRDEVAARLDAKTLADAKKTADSFQPLPTVSSANEVAAPPGGWDNIPARSGSTSGLKTGGTAKVSSM